MYKCGTFRLRPDSRRSGVRKSTAKALYFGRSPNLMDSLLMPKLDDQISTLQEKLNQLKLRQQRQDARKRASDALRERKATTRRKILVGGVVMAKVQQGEIDNELFRSWLDQALTRADDRALFALPARAADDRSY
jgi:hypothetical protein